MTEDDHAPGLSTQLRDLLDSWTLTPAFVRDRHLTVIGSNPLARSVSPSFEPGVNLARFTFLDRSVAHDNPDDWREIAREVAAMLRDSLEQHEADARFQRIVGELAATSAVFADAWADDGHRMRQAAAFTFQNERVGPMRLAYQQLRIPEDYESMLVVWTPVGEPSRERLARLAELVAGG